VAPQSLDLPEIRSFEQAQVLRAAAAAMAVATWVRASVSLCDHYTFRPREALCWRQVHEAVELATARRSSGYSGATKRCVAI
jgi:hypothetical protein